MRHYDIKEIKLISMDDQYFTTCYSIMNLIIDYELLKFRIN